MFQVFHNPIIFATYIEFCMVELVICGSKDTLLAFFLWLKIYVKWGLKPILQILIKSFMMWCKPRHIVKIQIYSHTYNIVNVELRT